MDDGRRVRHHFFGSHRSATYPVLVYCFETALTAEIQPDTTSLFHPQQQ